MKKTVLIAGMMSPHSEAHMKKIFEEIPGVLSSTPSHAEKCAALELSRDVSEQELKQAVEKAGYQFLGLRD
jgi:Cu2+-exporting ATPase